MDIVDSGHNQSYFLQFNLMLLILIKNIKILKGLHYLQILHQHLTIYVLSCIMKDSFVNLKHMVLLQKAKELDRDKDFKV